MGQKVEKQSKNYTLPKAKRTNTKCVQHIFSHGIIIFVGEQTNERTNRKSEKKHTQLNCIKLNIIVRKNRISNANVNMPTWCPSPSQKPRATDTAYGFRVFAFDAEQEQVLHNAAAYAFVINYTRVHDAVQTHTRRKRENHTHKHYETQQMANKKRTHTTNEHIRWNCWLLPRAHATASFGVHSIHWISALSRMC